MFNVELPPTREPRRFEIGPPIQSSLVRDIEETICSVHLDVLGMLRPKGVLTRELQQPPRLNHRMLMPDVLLNPHKSDDTKTVSPPLMESVASGDGRLSFENGDLISLTPFEVGQGISHVVLRTHSRVEVAADDSHDKYDGFIVDPHLRAGLCTRKSFKRLLKVLGFEWNYPPGSDNLPVDMTAFVSLMKMLSRFSVSTNAEIKRFMEFFCLDRLIELDDTLTPAQNRDRLSEVFSALQPCRLAVYNGQHREAALKAALSDLWFPSGILHRNAREHMKEFREVAGTYPYASIDHDTRDFQCFKKLKVAFGIVSNVNQLDEAIRKFRKYGTIQAAAQSTTVRTNHASILNEYIINFTTRLPGYTFPDFENHWKPTYLEWKKKFGDGISMIARDFAEFLEEHSYENQCGYDHKMKFQKDLIQKEMSKLDGTSTVITTTTDRKTGIPGQVLYMAMLLKLVATSPTATNELTRFLSGVTPSVANKPINPETKAAMGTFDFMKHSLYVPLLHVIESVQHTVAEEIFWLKAIENHTKNKDLYTILSKNDFSGIIDISSWPMFENELKSANSMQLQRLTQFTSPIGLKRKIWTSLMTELVTDCLQTLVHYGMNPVLTKHYYMNPQEFEEHQNANLYPNDSLRACLM